jgi:AcrR family transcriptional regulator
VADTSTQRPNDRSPTTRRRATRPPLSHERIVTAAIALADRHGIDGVTMRSVAARLGYEVMSLYNHVANKDDLLAAMLDAVVADIAPAPRGPWQQSIRTTAMSARDVLIAHPWAGGLWTSHGVGPARLALMESLLAALRTAGFGPALAYHGYHALLLHIIGFTQQELSYSSGLSERAEEFLADFPADSYPHLAEHIGQHMDPTAFATPGEDYRFVLDLIVDGLARLKRQQRRR